MCGLVALLKPKNYSDPKSALSLALEVTKHRGLPGREGRYEDSHVGLGFNRLPIRGLSSAYDQPIYNIEENMVGMFVGEIFNTDWTNDAEYAFEVLRNHGPKGLTKCDGFWSIVKHDTKHHTTEVLTDHLAIKPLYWNRATGTIASELRAIEAIDRLSLNEHYLANVLKWGYDPMGQTPYEGVVKLKPGFHYQFKNGDLRSYHQYFPLRPTSGSLRKALTEATHGRLLSDIPVAVLCSGGLD